MFLSKHGFVQISLNIFIQLLKLNNDFKYFIYVARVLKRGVDGGGW